MRLLLEQRVGGDEISGLPCLDSGRNSNLTSDDMDDIRRQEIAVDDDNNSDLKNIPNPKNIPDEVPQLEESYSWI